MTITVTLNGTVRTAEVRPDTTLFDFLREQGCYSVKCGCETSNCGLCTVRADGHTIDTLEGLQEEAAAFGACLADEGAEQCGFCSPGLILSVLALARELHDPTDDEIRHYLAGNLCRCTGYQGQLRAIRRYLSQRKEADC